MDDESLIYKALMVLFCLGLAWFLTNGFWTGGSATGDDCFNEAGRIVCT